MWYPRGYANTFICAPAHGGRASYLRDRSPVLVRLDSTSLPDTPRQCREVANNYDCTLPALHRPHGPQHSACVPPAWSHRAAAPFVTTAHDVGHLRRWRLRGPPGAVAPASADLRQAHKPVDARAGRRGQFCARPDAAPGQRRNHACGPPPLARVLEAGQTVDHESRSCLCPKKTARPADPAGDGPADVVPGFWRRSLVASPRPARPTLLDRRRSHAQVPGADPAYGRPDPKALACYGLLRPRPQQADQMWLRLVTGRPVSAVTLAFLAWGSTQLAVQGFTALLLSWDNASWHRSQAVRHWIRQHNQRVKRGAVGGRLVRCHLPSKSPWLNPIEPKWAHGKRAVSEADWLRGADELEARVYAYYGCQRETHLVMQKKVA
jgi:DDE superfamily endonuclease